MVLLVFPTMSNILACSPDPQAEEDKQLALMIERINNEEFQTKLNATDYEKGEKHLRRFLKKAYFDLEVSLNQWHLWVEWRHEAKVDSITDEEVANELKEGVMFWKGHNKKNMKCCVVTGRMLDPINRPGTCSSFRKYMIRTVEEGLAAADQTEQEKVCVIYDRRGLDYQHIDPNLYQFCKPAIDSMREFYNDRLGVIYVLHANVFFWLLYHLLLRPFMGLFSSENKIIVLDKPSDLLEYFDEDQLFLLTYTEDTTASSTAGSESGGAEGGSEHGARRNSNTDLVSHADIDDVDVELTAATAAPAAAPAVPPITATAAGGNRSDVISTQPGTNNNSGSISTGGARDITANNSILR